jgi:short-subunit dehydrogenase
MLSLAKEYKKSNINFTLLTMGSILTAFGPLSVEDKKEKSKKGKQYLDPKWLAHHIVSKIKNDTLEDEVSIYPSHYYEESRKDKR